MMFALRLMPGDDLRTGLEEHIEASGLKAGCVISCVGSLVKVRLRLAGASEIKEFIGPFEIVSLVGTLCADGVHLHISISDAQGLVLGGHLCHGSQIYTTAEIVLCDIQGYRFSRQMDPATGYPELNIVTE